MSSLAMSTVRDLEDLIIDAIYLDILCGKLDQKDSQLEVEYTMGGQSRSDIECSEGLVSLIPPHPSLIYSNSG